MRSRAITVPDAATIERIQKLCGMFGSDHPGERSNAARMADKLVRQAGLTWRDLICPQAEQPNGGAESRWREPHTWRDAMRLCVKHADIITDWELGFAELLRNYRSLTPRQNEILWQIVDKLRTLVCEAA